MQLPVSLDSQSVFLNVPFDLAYRPKFIALIAGLTALGRTPRCVLEVEADGASRLDRLLGLISSCGASIHDLSRVSLSGSQRLPRFNMPFEVGLAVGIGLRGSHRFFLFEEKPFRLQASLSDLNGHDPHIHGGTQTGVLRCLLDCFAADAPVPQLAELRRFTSRVSTIVSDLESDAKIESPFHRHLFVLAVRAAGRLARDEGFIE